MPSSIKPSLSTDFAPKSAFYLALTPPCCTYVLIIFFYFGLDWPHYCMSIAALLRALAMIYRTGRLCAEVDTEMSVGTELGLGGGEVEGRWKL